MRSGVSVWLGACGILNGTLKLTAPVKRSEVKRSFKPATLPHEFCGGGGASSSFAAVAVFSCVVFLDEDSCSSGESFVCVLAAFVSSDVSCTVFSGAFACAKLIEPVRRLTLMRPVMMASECFMVFEKNDGMPPEYRRVMKFF